VNVTSIPAGARALPNGERDPDLGADTPAVAAPDHDAPGLDERARDLSLARRRDVPWRFTAFLTFGSAWAAAQLWFWPTQFPLGNTPMSLSASIRGRERLWSIVCMLTALLMASGLACRVWTSLRVTSAIMTIGGLFLTIVMWTIVGVSWSLDFPHSLAPVMLIGGSLGAAWQLMQWKSPRSRTRR
jgi:hypothetical protein